MVGRYPIKILPVSMDTCRWLMQSKRLSRCSWRERWLYRWQAIWFEWNLIMQNRQCSANEVNDPLFILGIWRSGTTIAHNLMNSFYGLYAPKTWQCMNPSTFITTGPPKRKNSVRRPMDRYTIDSFSAQEDEFALLALGVETVYRGFLDPERLCELECLLYPDYWLMKRDWEVRLKKFLSLVQSKFGDNNRLVLKSPGHSYRVKSIVKIFPKASYVWMIRDPKDIFHSNRKMWSSMFNLYAMSNWSEDALDTFLLTALNQAALCLEYMCDQLGPERLIVIDFQHLIEKPVAVMETVAKRLNLKHCKKVINEVSHMSPQMRNGKKYENYDNLTIPAESQPILIRLNECHSRSLETHGT